MLMQAPTHPRKEQLLAFGQGKLDAAESAGVEEHLADCRECCATLLDLKDDTFVGLVRAARPAVEDKEAEFAPRRHEGTEAEKKVDPAAESAENHAATIFVQSGESAADTVVDLPLPSELRNHPRYRIVELIGRGGMGNVYRAEHRLMNRPVAIKLINAELVRHPQAVERFRREVQAAARLTHPNIVTAYDAEQAGDTHFLVMEFVAGTDLASIVQTHGPLPVAEACEFIRQAAEGLQHAHEKGMVHRDIKPHNLMLAGTSVRILDFGLAGFATESAVESIDSFNREPKACALSNTETIAEDAHASGSRLNESGPLQSATAQLTTLGSVMGTPDYIAPEQARDAHSADVRADIYSLGCTLWFLLTGKPPFEASGVLQKLKAHAELPPPDLTAARRDVPPALAAVVKRMLAKNPNERFQTPAEVATALKRVQHEMSASRREATQPAAPRSPAKIWLAVAGLALTLLLALGVIIVVATDRGQLVIQSNVDDVQVVVKESGKQVEILDLKTGTQVKWLPGGEYELKVVGRENDVTLDRGTIRMSRLNRVLVTAAWNTAGRGVIRAFSSTDQPLTQDGVAAEDGGWKITTADTRSVRLFEVPNPQLAPGQFLYRAKLKTENVKGKAYLEMWCRFPGQGEFFSKGLANPATGTVDWFEAEIPFVLSPGQQPDLVKLNLTIEDGGTVWIKDIELFGRTLGQKPAPPDTAAAPENRPLVELPLGQNLVTDPSLEQTAVGERYPATWGTGNLIPPEAYRHQVIDGGRTGQRGWMIEGDGQYAVVPSNRPPAHPAYRYAARAWVKIESGAAQIKLLYFDATGRYLGENRGSISATQGEWHRLSMTDDLAKYPEARTLSLALTLIGKGKAVFDDLELTAFDANRLPTNFESQYGAAAVDTSDLFDRWVGRWSTTTVHRPTAAAPKELTIQGESIVRKIFDGRYLLWQWASEAGDQQYLAILGLNEHVGGYHLWVFGSNGEIYERIGQWDKAALTLTLDVKPSSPGVSGSSTDRFLSNDRIESTLLVKNADGQITRNMQATWVRKSPDVPEEFSLANGPVAGSPELAVLSKMAGDWTIRQTIKPCVWFPNGDTANGSERVAWAVGGRFLLFRAHDDQQRMTSLAIETYEPEENSYHHWHFASDVFAGQWRITWDASSRGFHWRSMDMPAGWIGTGFNRWINDDTFDNQALIKDEQGRVMLDSTQDKRRKK